MIKLHWRFLGVSYLAQDVNVLFSEVLSHIAEKQQSSPCSLLASLSERSCLKRELIPVHHNRSPTLDIMLRDLESFLALYFIVSHVNSTPYFSSGTQTP
jgi:hypothetical protein